MSRPNRPKLGVHLSNHGPSGDSLVLARLAEEEALDTVWLSEDLYFRGAMPIAGAIAATTSRIEIGLGVVTPQLRHAALLAMEAAALVDIAGPRIIIGVGAGVAARVKAIGLDSYSPLGAVREVVDVMRRLLAGETVTRTEGSQPAADLALSFSDLPPAPPIYVAAVGPRALVQAGRIADGAMLSILSSRRQIAWATDRVRSGAIEASREPGMPIAVYLPMAIGAQRGDAIASLKPVFAYYLQRLLKIESMASLFTDWGPLPEEEIRAIGAHLDAGQPATEAIPDEVVLAYAIAGDLDDCGRQIEELMSLGVTDLVVDPNGGLAEKEALVRALGSLRRTL